MSRTRSTTFNNTSIPCVWSYYLGGALQGVYYFGHHGRNWVKSITDEVTVGYTAKLKNGEFLPINPCYINNVDVVMIPMVGRADNTGHAPGAYYLEGNGNPYNWVGFTYPDDYTYSDSDVDAVVIKALAKAKEPDLDVLTFFAELPKSVALLARTFGRFDRFSKRIAYRARRRELRRSKRQKRSYDYQTALNDFTTLWLEGRYGWRPMYYDILSIMKALRHKSRGRLARRVAQKTFAIEESKDDTRHFASNSNWTQQFRRSGTCKIRATVFYSDDMTAIGANPFVTFWELTRFSFVIDWFIDIGSWIYAVTPRVGFTGLGISVSVTSKFKDVDVINVSGLSPWVYTMTAGGHDRKVERYQRFEYTSSLPLPSIQVNLNRFKVLDLVALAIQSQNDVIRILRY